MDLTAYFDTNVYANKETFQFISQTFNNNIAIDWGGDVNFFGPGIVAAYSPIEWLTAMGGWFHGGRLNNTDLYNRFFKNPWFVAELDLKPRLRGRPGNYRFYAWRQETPRCPFQIDATPCLVESKKNQGVGLSFDQEITDLFGLWARFGTQDGEVGQFDRAFSIGAQVSGAPISRPDDVLGIAYGQTLISTAYRNISGRSGNEHYLEAYYRFVAVLKALEFSPDIQFIKNPGGNARVSSFYVVGLRAQVFF